MTTTAKIKNIKKYEQAKVEFINFYKSNFV